MKDRAITLITGTRKGIGRFLAEHYAQKGHLVIGISRNPVDWSQKNYQHYQGDVADEQFVKATLSAVRREHGRLDHLINNAGIASMNHALLTPLAKVHEVLNTNLVGTFLLCRESVKIMQRLGHGRIVNFSTIAVPLKLAGEAIYVASKAAVTAFTEVLARELAGFGITVNAVGPTPIATDLIQPVPKEKIDQLLLRQAIPRLGAFEDVANVIDFFLKKESAFITGQTIFLGGV